MSHPLSSRNVILQGHCLDVLRSLPDGCVQTIVTSPPYYGLRDYATEPQVWGGISTCDHIWGEVERSPWANELPGPEGRKKNTLASRTRTKTAGAFCMRCEAWCGEVGQEPTPQLFIAHLVQIFRECGRVLRRDGTLWIDIGDAYAGNGHMGKQGQTGQRANRAFTANGTKPKLAYPEKSLLGMPWRLAFALVDEGWILRSDIVWEKPNCMPESVQDRPTKSHEYVFLFAKSPRYFYDALATAEPVTGNAHPRGHGVSPKSAEPSSGIRANASFHAATSELVEARNARTVWSIPTTPLASAHFATFPPSLAERMILSGSSPYACEVCGAPWKRVVQRTKMVTRQGNKRGGYGSRTTDGISGTMISPASHITSGWKPTCLHESAGEGRCLILDPFSGAGTVALVAQRLGRDYLGIELNPDYVAMAEDRIFRDTLPDPLKDTPRDLIPPRLFDALEDEAVTA